MTYFDFLFSQLFMVQLNKYRYFEYDLIFNDIKYFIEQYYNSIYYLQYKSEHDCINDFLKAELIPYIIKKYQ